MLTTSKQLMIALALLAMFYSSGCVKRQFTGQSPHVRNSPTAIPDTTNSRTNINTASSAELEKLPGIGKGLAARIIEHREQFGPFRKPEHLITVRGISDKRFRALQDFITVE